jgi:hypothetical protein
MAGRKLSRPVYRGHVCPTYNPAMWKPIGSLRMIQFFTLIPEFFSTKTSVLAAKPFQHVDTGPATFLLSA